MPKLLHDPRTVARDVPGLFDAVFPRLTTGVVAYLNKRKSSASGMQPISAELVEQSSLDRAMLFELGVDAGEMLLTSGNANWEECKRVALARQRRYFDAELPGKIADVDQVIAELAGRNIATSIDQFAVERAQPVIVAPLYLVFVGYRPAAVTFRRGLALLKSNARIGFFQQRIIDR